MRTGVHEPAHSRQAGGDGPLETSPYDETPSMAWLHMVHVGSGDPPPPEPRGAHGPPE